MDRNNHYAQDPNEDDKTSDALIRAFSPQNDQDMEEEILQQVTQSQGLSPRGLNHGKFHFKNQDIKTVTIGRQNTRLFSSRVSQ